MIIPFNKPLGAEARQHGAAEQKKLPRKSSIKDFWGSFYFFE
ncbi:hypothetical protein [Bacillus sp. ISL-75]|nr:hypothetical protein [Bacillus sp. ISL-75]